VADCVRVQYFDDVMAQQLSSRYARKFNRRSEGKVRFADVSVIKMEWDAFASVETYLPGGAHRDLAKSLSNLRTMHVHIC
jgi:hypothetical protein